jgi:3-isopropylmalate dehydratase small subunit
MQLLPQHPLAIKAAGLSGVIAKLCGFFTRLFQHAVSPFSGSAEAVEGTRPGDELLVDREAGTIQNLTTGKTYQAQPIPPFMQQLIEAGGLMNYVKNFKMKQE